MKHLSIAFCCCIALCTSIHSFAQKNPKTLKITIDHVAIYVVDLQKEASFYRDILQFDTLAEPFHDNKHAWFTIGNGIALHMIQGADKPKEYFKNNHLCMSVASLDAFTAQLKNRKVTFEDKDGNLNTITTRVDGIHQIWIKDPEGYWIEVNDAKH